MNHAVNNLAIALAVSAASGLSAQGLRPQLQFSLTVEMQEVVDGWKKLVQKWGATPRIVEQATASLETGAARAMSNELWAKLEEDDPAATAPALNGAGLWLAQQVRNSRGALGEAFLLGNDGQVVAFASRTPHYLYRGQPCFEVAHTKGLPWQGEAIMDPVARRYVLPIAVPVFAPQTAAEREEGTRRVIGTLVVGVRLSHLARAAAIEVRKADADSSANANRSR